MRPVETVGTDKFLEKIEGRIVHDSHMVRIPTNRAADMEHKLGNKEKEGCNLVGNILGRLIMAGVEGIDNFPGSAVALIEVHRPDCIALKADTKEFRFDAAFHSGKILLENLIERCGEKFAVIFPIDSEIL